MKRQLAMVGRVLVAVTVASILATVAPDRAPGSFPGENGRFVFTWHAPEDVAPDVIATSNAQGGDLRVLASCGDRCMHWDGDWSPSGRRLVYVEAWGIDLFRLVTVRPDGSDRRVIRTTRSHIESPVWSPDAQRIAFTWYRWSNRLRNWTADIFLIRRDGTDLRRVTRTSRSEGQLDWSSLNRLAFAKGRDLFTMRPNGTALRQLTNTPHVAEGSPDWAPGGTRLTFTRPDAIWRIGRWGRNALRLASGYSPTWAPDGSVIAFVSLTDDAIHTVTPWGEDETVIGKPVDGGSISQLDWQPR
jgi:Tol biopolymer transport system component